MYIHISFFNWTDSVTRFASSFVDDVAEGCGSYLRLWRRKRAFRISIRRVVKTLGSKVMIETLFHVIRKHDQCLEPRTISVSHQRETPVIHGSKH